MEIHSRQTLSKKFRASVPSQNFSVRTCDEERSGSESYIEVFDDDGVDTYNNVKRDISSAASIVPVLSVAPAKCPSIDSATPEFLAINYLQLDIPGSETGGNGTDVLDEGKNSLSHHRKGGRQLSI